MKIHEYQAKKFFSDYAIPVERHILCNTAQEVTAAFSQLGNEKVAIKAQVLTGGRGKAGGVKLAGNAEEALQHAEAILGMTIKDFPVTRVIVSEAVNIHLEYYVSFRYRPQFPFSCPDDECGRRMDIEEVARRSPKRYFISGSTRLSGIPDYLARRYAFTLFDKIAQV